MLLATIARLSLFRHHGFAECFRRVFATACAVLVLALGIFATNPSWHDQLHHGAHMTDDGCAVVMFAGGVSVPLAVIELPAPEMAWQEQSYARLAELRLPAPHYRLLPAQAPPVA